MRFCKEGGVDGNGALQMEGFRGVGFCKGGVIGNRAGGCVKGGQCNGGTLQGGC